MEFEKKGTIWAGLVVVFGFIYTLAAYTMFSGIATAIGIELLGEIGATLFILSTICLFCYLHENPFILYATKEGQKRALIAMRLWQSLGNIRDDKLDLFEDKVRNILNTM